MTNKEKAAQLWAIVMDRARTNPEHRAALDELLALKKQAKTSLDKLGVPQVMWDREDETNRKHAELAADLKDAISDPAVAIEPKADPLDEPTPQEDRAAIVEAVGKGEPLPMGAVVRGLISAEVRRLLLDTPSTYAEIEAAVRAKYPEAKTTTRSIASVASDMRRAGKPVPQRRKEASK